MGRPGAILLTMLARLAAADTLTPDAPRPDAAAAPPAPDAYVSGIEQWRSDFDTDVRDGMWLKLVDRVALEGTKWSIGSARDASVRLPPRAPAHLGVLRRDGESFRFEPAPAAHVRLDGRRLTAAAQLPTKAGTGNLAAGAISMHVRYVGADAYLFVTDESNPAAAAFRGNAWYPVDPAWRLPARFEPYAQTRIVPVPLTHVSSRTEMPSTGEVVLEHDGQTVRLQSFIDDEQLFVMFLDPTNGRGTYGGGRFLHAPLPQDGRTELDFNKAFNPYCSLNANVMCPVPPEGNRLPFAVEAGEKFNGE